MYTYLKNLVTKGKTTFASSEASWVLRLMLLFLISTLLQGLIPFALNSMAVFAILAIIICHDFCCFTLWRAVLCLYIVAGTVFTTVNASEASLNMKDWFYFATALLFVDYLAEDAVRSMFSDAIEKAQKQIDVVSLSFCALTLVSLLIPGAYGIKWEGIYYFGFTGDAHIAANGLCLLAVFRLLSFRGKPFSLIDLCQLVFLMAVVFMAGVRTCMIPAVIIVYAYMEEKIRNKTARKVMYGVMIIAVIIIFANSNMRDKFLWTLSSNPTNIIDSINAMSSGRLDFWAVDLQAFAEASWIEKLLGCGFDYVYQTNLQYLDRKLWAHNDLIHLLLGAGLSGACVYIAVWVRFWRKYRNHVKSWLLRLCIAVYVIFPMMVNGVFLNTHYLMSIFVFIFFLAFEDRRLLGLWLNEEMNIAMFGHKRILTREGGVEIVVEELSTKMAAQGHKVTCYSRGGHHVSGVEFDGQELAEYKGVRIKTVWTIDRKGLAAVTSSFFAAVRCAFSKAKIVHIHAEGPAFMCWIPKLFGKRVVVTVHGLDWQREKWKPGGFASKFIRLGEKMAVWFADEIIVLSRNVQDYFWSTYRRETRWIPNGVTRPECVAAEEIAQKFGLTKDSYILFLGRLVPEKGIHYLVKAFQRVDTNKKLVIAGGSSDTDDYLQRLKRLAAEDEQILFTGFVQGRMLEELYSNAYVYVLPSDVEGMPLSLLEAMSFGNCCLTSDIEECTEVTRRQGVTFRKGDVTDLVEKLQDLCDDTALVKKYKSEAADYICRKYSWDAVVEETLALYRGDVNHESIAGQ